MSDAYDMIDRFLRNNLGSDDDYAEYSKALDSLCGAQPAQAGHVPAASCGECGKKASDGWALYCVACMEEAGLPAVTDSPPLMHSCTSSLGKTPDSTAQAGHADTRTCTCHPDDNPPVPCPRKFSLTECKQSQAGQALTDEEIDAAYEKARADYQRSRFAVRGQQLTAQDSPDWWFARAIEAAVRAKLGVAVPMTDPQLQTSEERRATGERIMAQATQELSDLVRRARDIVVGHQKGSISLVQRHLRISYNTAAKLMEALEQQGVVSPQRQNGQREVLVLPDISGIVGKEGA